MISIIHSNAGDTSSQKGTFSSVTTSSTDSGISSLANAFLRFKNKSLNCFGFNDRITISAIASVTPIGASTAEEIPICVAVAIDVYCSHFGLRNLKTYAVCRFFRKFFTEANSLKTKFGLCI